MVFFVVSSALVFKVFGQRIGPRHVPPRAGPQLLTAGRGALLRGRGPAHEQFHPRTRDRCRRAAWTAPQAVHGLHARHPGHALEAERRMLEFFSLVLRNFLPKDLFGAPEMFRTCANWRDALDGSLSNVVQGTIAELLCSSDLLTFSPRAGVLV